MTDYIKREDAIKWLTNLQSDCGLFPQMWHYGEALEQIIKLFDADVAPVRHGRWIYEGNELVCSRCGGPVSFSRNNDGLALSGKAWALGIYCQTCGAKMDDGAV